MRELGQNRNPDSRQNEHGIALLFALVILTLLSVIGLAFVKDAFFEQKAGYNAAAAASARMLAEAEVKKVLTVLKYYDSGVFYSHDVNMIHGNKSGTLTETFDNIDRLHTEKDGSFVFEWISDAGFDHLHWNYITLDDDGDSSTYDRIIGRTAFVLIPDSGISPASLVSSTYDERDFDELRLGVDTNEMNIRSIAPELNDDDIVGVLNWTILGGQFTGTWTDFAAIFSAYEDASVPTADGLTTDLKNDFRSWFVPDAQPDREAFWVDLNNDKIIQNDISAPADFELYHRFNLARTDWSSLGIRHILFTNNDADALPNRDMAKWDDTSTNDGSGIPWLALFGMKQSAFTDTIGGVEYDRWEDDDTLKGTFPSVVARRRQIAANLIDYCDSDSVPTSDVTPSTWNTSTNIPSYTGNELTPYINEIGVDIQVTAERFAPNVQLVVTQNVYAEIINIYPQLVPPYANARLEISGNIEFNVYWNGSLTADSPVSAPFTVNMAEMVITNAAWNGAGNAQYAGNSTSASSIYDRNGGPGGALTIEIKEAVVTINKVVLEYDGAGKNVDYASIDTASPEVIVFSETVPAGDGALRSGNKFISFQTYDPRQNLNPGDWYVVTDTTVGDSIGFVNANAVPPPIDINNITIDDNNFDWEPVSDPAYIDGSSHLSTAWIANRPMLSPWEIGFIHRGAKWETINLKEYDKNKAVKAVSVNDGGTARVFIPGGGKYTDTTDGGGDANILDQIKMTSDPASPKKINIKSHMDEVYRALFNKIRLECVPDSTNFSSTTPANTGLATEVVPATTTVLDATKAMFVGGNNLVSKIKESNINFDTRAALASVAEYSTGEITNDGNNIPRLNDAAREELIGKTINLTEVSGQIEYFTLIVLAQSINDVGASSGGGITITAKDREETLHTIANCRIGTFDFDYGSEYDFDTYGYADTITGEQKIMVRGYRDGSSVRILSYEYVD